MSIPSEITRIKTNIAAAYDEAEVKGATMPATENSANLADTIASIPQGGQPVEEKDVNFYDYDGTVLYTYTSEEALSLSTLPEALTHEGLTFQGWNRTLAELQSYVNKYGMGDAGATYITNDGKTRLFLTVPSPDLLQPTLYIQLAKGTLTVTVNGSNPISVTNETSGYSNEMVSLTLPDVGTYPANHLIELSYSGSEGYNLGQNNTSSALLGSSTAYKNMLRKVEIGDRCMLKSNAFYVCGNLETIVIPNGITTIPTNCFYLCPSLKCAVLPAGLTTIESSSFFSCSALKVVSFPNTVVGSLGSYTFQNCGQLSDITLPEGVTGFSSYAFQSCFSIKKIVIPDTFKSIGNNSFYSCTGLEEIIGLKSITSIPNSAFYANEKLQTISIPSTVASIGGVAFQNCGQLIAVDLSEYRDPSTLPTLYNIAVFNSNPSDQIFYVANQEMLDAFSSAPNWSNFASRFRIKT